MKENNIRINVIVNIIRTLALTLVSFLTFPYVCRVLGDSTLGLYTWCNTFVYYFLIIAKIGIPNLAIRECVKARNDKEKLSNIAQSFFLLQCVTTVLSFGLMCIFVFANKQLFDARSIIFLLSVNFLAGAFSFEWVFIALEKQLYMSIRSLIVLALSTILIISLVTSKDDIYIYCACTVGVTVVTTIINVFFIGKYISFKKTMPYNYKQYAKPLLTLFLISLFLALYNQTDEFILGYIDNTKAEVGSYSIAVKAIDIIIGIMSALSTVFIPRSAFYYQMEDKKYFHNSNRYAVNICLFIVLPAIVTMCFLSEPICALISGNADLTIISQEGGFNSAPLVLIILASMMLTYSISEMIYGQILLPQKKEKYYMFALGGGFILNLGLSLLFALLLFKNLHPSVSVAIATVLTDVLVCIYLVKISWKDSKSSIFCKNSIKLLIGNAIIALVSMIFILTPYKQWLFSICGNKEQALMIMLISVVLIDAIVYVGSLLLMKEDLVYSFVKKKPKEI